MHIDDRLGLANADVFGQENLEFGQGKVSEKSGNFTLLCFVETLQLDFFIIKLRPIYTSICDRLALLFTWALWPFKIWNRGPPSRSRPRSQNY